ncbi:MAG: L,D-transpeptidase family protein [Verrucomicrobiales bacterium]|nr:L,D-transpeptidase family protein [Verrucomicrobiales bacterium]
MGITRLSTLFFIAILLIGTPESQGQDRPFLNALFGAKPAQSSRSAQGGKRVEINLTQQRLYAYQGNRLVMKTRISSGRTGNTPTGRFTAGPYKSATHFSSIYDNAPMPWSVQVTGNIFIHGFSVVPNYPASKGCIRVPISGFNPAKKLYNWLDVGTPIRITY